MFRTLLFETLQIEIMNACLSSLMLCCSHLAALYQGEHVHILMQSPGLGNIIIILMLISTGLGNIIIILMLISTGLGNIIIIFDAILLLFRCNSTIAGTTLRGLKLCRFV
jgi:hypothetical protein